MTQAEVGLSASDAEKVARADRHLEDADVALNKAACDLIAANRDGLLDSYIDAINGSRRQMGRVSGWLRRRIAKARAGAA